MMDKPDEIYVMAHQPPSASPRFPIWGFLLLALLAIAAGIGSYVVLAKKTSSPGDAPPTVEQPPVAIAPPIIPSPKPTPAPSVEPVQETIYFEWDSTDISGSQTAKLESFWSSIKGKTGTLEITGHSDNSGSEAYNQKLSQERAETVNLWLQNQGMDNTGALKIQGFGETQPATNNETEENRALNRRVVIQFTSDRP